MATPRRRAALLTVTAVAISVVGVAVPAPTAAAAAGVDPGAVELTLAPGANTTVNANVTTSPVAPNPDIVFLADTTGSMDPALANVRNNLPSIMAEVRSAQPTARFGVAEYKEQGDGDRVFRVDSDLTDDGAQVVSSAQRWLYDVGGGGQPQTDFLNAQFRLATGAVTFRPHATRVIVWFGDARSNDPSLGHTLADTVNALKDNGIRVIAVPVTGTSAPGLDERGQAGTITSRTFGVLMPSQSASAVAGAILSGIKALAVSVTAVPTCDQQLTLTPNRAMRSVRAGGTVTFADNVAVKPGTTRGTYRCTVDFQVNGMSVGYTQTISVYVPGAQPAISISDVTVDEGNEGTTPATLTVSMDRPATQQVTVGWATATGTADDKDFTAGSGTLTFAPGETTKQVTVGVLGDVADEPDETFTVHLSDATGATIDDADGVVTIRDDDEPVTLPGLRISDTSVPEGDEDTTATLTVCLDRPADEAVTVRWLTIVGTADSNDFEISRGQLTFEPGQTSKQIHVTVRGDDVQEPDETFLVRLTDPTAATIADADGVVTIVDDDSLPPPTDAAVRIGDATVPEGNVGTTPVTLTVTLDEPSTTPVPVFWSTVADTAGTDDFVDQGDDLTFAPGETSKQITVRVRGDRGQEGNETFFVKLSAPAAIDETAVVTIVEDDQDTGPWPAPPPPALRVGDVAVPEGDTGGTPATVTVVLDKIVSAPVSVNWRTVNGTATAPGDYTAGSGTLTFAPGQTAQQITVPIVGDPSAEDTETFAIELYAPVNAQVLDGSGVVTITNDDEYDSPAVLTVDDATVTENAGPAVLNVRLSSAAAEAVTVRVTTTAGSATDPGDYHGVDRTVTFQPGDTLVQVPVEIVDDADPESAETFAVELSSPSGASVADASAVVTIVDNDGAPGDLPVVSVSDDSVTEDGGSLAFLVTLTKPAAGEVTVAWATGDGTATAPADYVAGSGTVVFAPGQVSALVSVPVVDDTASEPDEMFTLTLSAPTGATTGDGVAVGTIVDNDLVTVGRFTCTADAANLLGTHPAIAAPGPSCADATRSAERLGLGLGLLTVQVTGLTATTDAAPGGMSATAGLLTTRISALGLVIELSTITATATVTCVAGPAGLTPSFSGSSSIGSLKVNGVRIPVDRGAVRVPLAVGSLTLNHTVTTRDGLSQRAFDVRTPLGNVVIGSSTVGAAGNPCR